MTVDADPQKVFDEDVDLTQTQSNDKGENMVAYGDLFKYKRPIHPSMEDQGPYPDYRPEQADHAIEQKKIEFENFIMDPDLIVPVTNMMQSWGEGIWIVNGPTVVSRACSYSTCMVVIRLHSGGAWIWSPVPYTKELAREVEGRCGSVRFIVSPNRYHHLHLREWAMQYPHAKLHVSPGLSEREDIMDGLVVDYLLTEDAPKECFCDVDSCLFRGSCDEAVFFHKASRTVIFADLIHRQDPSLNSGISSLLMSIQNVQGSQWFTPLTQRLSWWWNDQMQLARNALSVVLNEWKPEKLIIAHGECAHENATEIVERALAWMKQ